MNEMTRATGNKAEGMPPTDEEWDAIDTRAFEVIDRLEAAFRKELGIT